MGRGQPVPCRERSTLEAGPTLWNPVLFLWVTVGTILVIGMGSLYKISELSAGGEHVASMLGGRAVNPQTTRSGRDGGC